MRRPDRKPPAVSPLAERRARWLLLLGSLLLGLALCEGVLHFLGLPREHLRHTDPPQFAPMPETDYLYVNLPSREITFVYDSDERGTFRPDLSVTHTTNPKGFRGPDFSLDKPPAVIRFVFLGDSFTFGEGVRDSDTYPERFRALGNESGAFPGRMVEAINLGVGGYDTIQEAALLRDFGVSLSPDRIVVGYCLNDAGPPVFVRDKGGLKRVNPRFESGGSVEGSPVPFLIGTLRLTRLGYLAYEVSRRSARTLAEYRALYREDNPDWRKTRDALSEIGALGRDRGVPVTLMIFPVFFRLNAGYPFGEIHGRVRKEAEAAGMEVLDLYPLFKEFSGPDLWVHSTDQHPNEVAHRRVARGLWEFLRSPAAGDARIR